MEKSVPVYFNGDERLVGSAKIKYDGKVIITFFNDEHGDIFRNIVTDPATVGFTLGYLAVKER